MIAGQTTTIAKHTRAEAEEMLAAFARGDRRAIDAGMTARRAKAVRAMLRASAISYGELDALWTWLDQFHAPYSALGHRLTRPPPIPTARFRP